MTCRRRSRGSTRPNSSAKSCSLFRRQDPELGGGVVAEGDLPLAGPDADRSTDVVDLDHVDLAARRQVALVEVGEQERSLSLGDLGNAPEGGSEACIEGRQSTLPWRRLGVTGDGVPMGARARTAQ